MLGTVRKVKGSPNQDYAQALAEEYEAVMISGIMNHERSQQKLIGPSEIGVPCDRALLYKLAQAPEVPRGPAWKPSVGTACHAQQDEWFSRITTPSGTTPDDWLTEEKVAVGTIGQDTIKGSTDLFAKSGAVIDHKFVGKYKLKTVKADDHPGQQYQVQAHTYGVGWANDGWAVHIVMIVFHPRDGELEDSYYWWEDFNPGIAQRALTRANERYALLTGLGLEQALGLFGYCSDPYCDWCNRDRNANYDPPTVFAPPAAAPAPAADPPPPAPELPAFYN